MWVRRAAIRPIPSYARVAVEMLDRVESLLSDDDASGEEQLTHAFGRFEQTQPALSGRIAAELSRPADETALALGYFLSLAVWLAFDHAFGSRLREVIPQDIEAAQQSLALDEELRRNDPEEAVDTDDVVAMEQPALVEFIREHIDVALEVHPDTVAVDDVDAIYRLLLLETVALSHAVQPPEQFAAGQAEWTA